jgi:uncharacterized protein
MTPVLVRLIQRLPEVLSQTADLPSPCQSVCVMDPQTDWCTGCLRTLPEIAAWGRLNDAQKRRVWTLIGERSQNL